MNDRDILNVAKEELTSLDSHLIDVLDIKHPTTLAYAKQLAKVISKLSPLLGNTFLTTSVDKFPIIPLTMANATKFKISPHCSV